MSFKNSLVLAAVVTVSCFADPIASVTPIDPLTLTGRLGFLVNSGQTLAASWSTSGVGYSNVAISTPFDVDPPSVIEADAYLMRGGSIQTASEVAHTGFSVPGPFSTLQLFAGLELLPNSTYYLVLGSMSQTGFRWWGDEDSNALITANPDITIGPAYYAQGGEYQIAEGRKLELDITGAAIVPEPPPIPDPSQVPEPSSVILLSTGCALSGLVLRRRRQR